MTAYILVLYLTYYNTGGVTTQEFGSKAACEYAIVEIAKVHTPRVAICVSESLSVEEESAILREQSTKIVKSE
jgi:hypothetical protein